MMNMKHFRRVACFGALTLTTLSYGQDVKVETPIAPGPAPTVPANPISQANPIFDAGRPILDPGTPTVPDRIIPIPGEEFNPPGLAPSPIPGQEFFGMFGPGGQGFKLARTKYGEMNFSAWTYVRYLNQQALDRQYTDSFGRSRELTLRDDLQLNKATLYFKGWIYDPSLRYLLYAWTANTNQGDPAQVVIAGALSQVLDPALSINAGIGPLPGTRSLRGNFPYWLKVDSRTIADEFFRPSYTSGIWAAGALSETVQYKVMAGNNLSQLGVNASRLPAGLSTVSGSVWWMPTTGEFGPAGGYGDFEEHQDVATLFGISATRSREDRQSQPGTEGFNNTQIRLSDGTIIFSPDAFNTGGRINRATYQMLAMDAAVKYQGLSLETEYYFRYVDQFRSEGRIPVSDLFDHGFQVQASAMLAPKQLQAYATGSYVFGQYGEPWDAAVGLNWFPFKERLFRVNAETIYQHRSPVGFNGIPNVLGGTGLIFHLNAELTF
jgi:hypothetical protein